MKKLIRLYSLKNQILFLFIFVGLVASMNIAYIYTLRVIAFFQDPVQQYLIAGVVIPRAEADDYAYNERVPREVSIAKIEKLSAEYGFSDKLKKQWIACIQSESGFNNLAANKTSSALGLCQYLSGTWEETDSFKKQHLSPQDVNACLSEMAEDIDAGEHYQKWLGCWK